MPAEAAIDGSDDGEKDAGKQTELGSRLQQHHLTAFAPVCDKLDITHIRELAQYDFAELASDCDRYAGYTLCARSRTGPRTCPNCDDV